MARAKDLTGMKFGRLTVIGLNEEVSKQKKKSHWNCKCDCGNEKVVYGENLKGGRTTSCGCYKKELYEDKEFRQMKSVKMKELNEKMWNDEEFRRMQSEKRRKMNEKMWEDEKLRQTQSERMKKLNEQQWQDKEFRQMQSEQRKRMNEEMWQDEEFIRMHSERISGENSPSWKGGITPIKKHLGHLPVVKQWFDDSKKQANYTCKLTGKAGRVNTHHLKAFSTIVLEAHELHNIQVKQQVKDYTEEELHKLEEYVASWHKDTSNAVVLNEEVHVLFHSLYGKGGNTPEQYEEFKQRYIAGEFDEIIK